MSKAIFPALLACVLWSGTSLAEKVLDQQAVEALFQEKLISYQDLIAENKIEELQAAVKDFTHDETLILFEFSLQMPDQAPLPAQKAYFNREPFIALLKNAKSLEPDSFKIKYELEKFQPQFGGGSAIIHDSGTAQGRLNENFSGDSYDFKVTQKCRNTITADAKTMFKVDSIYCRMDIEYEPVYKIIKSVDHIQEVALEKPEIGDIISELEEKKRKESETE